jgi:hypothetical protein
MYWQLVVRWGTSGHCIKLLKAVMFSLAFLRLAADWNFTLQNFTPKSMASSIFIITRLGSVFGIHLEFSLVF